jgi:hypothetical protein
MAVIRFKHEWHGWQPGVDITLDNGICDIYVQQGHAEYVEPDAKQAKPDRPMLRTRDVPGPKDLRRQ